MTRDGGKSWSKVLYIDDATGATDLVMHRRAEHAVCRHTRSTERPGT